MYVRVNTNVSVCMRFGVNPKSIQIVGAAATATTTATAIAYVCPKLKYLLGKKSNVEQYVLTYVGKRYFFPLQQRRLVRYSIRESILLSVIYDSNLRANFRKFTSRRVNEGIGTGMDPS